jgi:ribosomal-protein-alanine N-acetyltransferase
MDLGVIGPTLTLRVPHERDAPALFALASDPEVTRWFSWGPYEREEQAHAYIARLPSQRANGEQLDLIVEHHEHGPIGITGISELSRRDRRGMVGTWLGRAWWGTGANRESKALVAHLAFGPMGLERLGAYTNIENGRSEAALRGVGFQREGVLRRWHRHGERQLDVAIWSLLREEWPGSDLHAVPAEIRGTLPRGLVFAPPAEAPEAPVPPTR